MAALGVGAAIYSSKRIPESISAMVWCLPWNAQWLWTIWMWLVTITLAPCLIDAMPSIYQFVAFFTIACLGFVGAMPLFLKQQRKAHNILGVSAGILSQVCVAFICPWWLSVWLLMAVALWKPIRSKAVMISECLCYVAMVGGIE